MQTQLAFAIILMFTGLAYVIFYMHITYVALWQPFHTLDISHLFKNERMHQISRLIHTNIASNKYFSN